MRYIYTLLACFMCVFTSSMYAQSFLDKVTVEELKETKNTTFPKADAVILNEEINVSIDYVQDYGFRVIEKVSRKVKLYNENGKKSLAFQVPYAPKGYASEELVIHQANIYSIENDTVAKSKIEKDGIVKNDFGNWREVGVSFSDAKKGDVITYSYSRVTSYLDELPEWLIQGDLPKVKTKYSVLLPEYFQYSIIQVGDLKLKETTNEKKIAITGILSPGSRSTVNAIEKSFEVYNVDRYRSEQYVDNPTNYIPALRFNLLEVHYPFSSPQKILLNEKEFFSDLVSNRGFARELKQDKYYKKDILVEEYNGLSVEDKITSVLQFVQGKVKWDNTYGIFVNNGVKTAYNRGSGNSADINLMLTSMLRYVGLQANPVLISTRSNGIKDTWQKNYFNHVISAVEVDGAYYLVDATSPYSRVNLLPLEDLNGKGIIIKENGSVVSVDLMPQFVSSITNKYQVELNIDGSIQGQVIRNYNNYDALAFRSSYNGSEWQLGKMYESQLLGLRVNNVRVYNYSEDLAKDVRVNYSLYKENAVSVFNNKLFINPFQLFSFNGTAFDVKERTSPIYFGYPTVENYLIGITIPQGYTVEKRPEDNVYKDEKSGLEISVKFTVSDNRIEGSLIFLKEKGVVDVKDYLRVREFYQKVAIVLQQQIVFARK